MAKAKQHKRTGNVEQAPVPLRELPFFAGLSPECFGQAETYVYHRDYEKRQIIFFPHDACDYVYWLRSGRVRVFRTASDERELSFRHVAVGGMLGEEAIAGRHHRQDYAEALSDTALAMMRIDDFHRLMRESAEFAQCVAMVLAGRNVALEQRLAQHVFLPVRSRIAGALMSVYELEQAAPGGTLPITHQELANLAGTTRETTTAVLHGLRDERMIAIANRRITVLEPSRLEGLVQDI